MASLSDTVPHRSALAGKGACNVLNTVLVVVRSLLLSVLVARSLGPELQGVYAVVLYVVQVAVQVVSLGFPSTIVRFVARQHAASHDDGVRAVISYVIRRELVLGALATVLCALLAAPLAHHVAGGSPSWLFLLAALAILPDSLTLAYEAGFEGLLAYEILLRINLALVPVSLAASAAVLAWGGRIAELLVLKTVLAVVRVVCYWVVLRRRLPRKGHLGPDDVRQMGAYARSLSVIFLFDTVVWQRSEVIFLGIFCSRTAIAFYDIAYLIVGTTMRVLPEKLTDILFPVLAGLEGLGQRMRTAELYGQSVRLLFAMTLGIAVTLAVYADIIVLFLYGREYAEAARVIRILCAAAPVVIVARATAYVLYAAGWQDFNVRLAGAAAVTNIVLALVLIPRSCILGAALANSITQAASVCVLVSYVLRRSKMTLPWQAMARALAAAAVQAILMRGIVMVLPGWAGIIGGSLAGLVTYGILLAWLGVIEPDEWRVAAARVGMGPRRKESAGGRN